MSATLPKLVKFSDQTDRFKDMNKAALLELFGNMIKLDERQHIELISLGKNHGAVTVPAMGADWSLIGWRLKSYADDTIDHVLYAINVKTKQIKFINTQLDHHFTFSFEQAVDYADQHFGSGGKHLFDVLAKIAPESFTIEIGDQDQATVFTENLRIWSVGGSHVSFLYDKPVKHKADHYLMKLAGDYYCVGINTAKRTFEVIDIRDHNHAAQYIQA